MACLLCQIRGVCAYKVGATPMPKGIYRETDGWVRVNYGKFQISIPRRKYEAIRYEPPYAQLPTKNEYDKALA